ncbi:hypothetical protein ACHAW5_001517 [Stephanodiscus triporus]|uniref:Vacuolar protein sorting-associated protein 29 n=1 Tax=Stephanodiscus triporus TaxID=2934178 RepID=A0ABD3PF41_9STRA
MSSNFGELVLLVGDHHIPMRAHSIPKQFRKLLIPGKMQRVLCTGNVGCVEEYDRLKNLVGGSANDVICVAGEYDRIQQPSSGGHHHHGGGGGGGGGGGMTTAGVGGGDDAAEGGGGGASSSSSSSLSLLLPSLPETKVINLGQFRVGLIGGHQVVPWGDLSALSMVRRRMNVDVLVCGRRRKVGVVEYEAYDSCTPDVNPSFILLAIQGNKVVCYVYELKDGEVDVSKTEFSK